MSSLLGRFASHLVQIASHLGHFRPTHQGHFVPRWDIFVHPTYPFFRFANLHDCAVWRGTLIDVTFGGEAVAPAADCSLVASEQACNVLVAARHTSKNDPKDFSVVIGPLPVSSDQCTKVGAKSNP